MPGMSVLDISPRVADGGSGLPTVEVPELYDLRQLAGAFVIIAAPTVVDSAAAQAASLAADATILVINPQVARVAETLEAVGVLRESGVALLGAVLAPLRDKEDVDGGGATWSWWPTSTASAEQTEPDRISADHAAKAASNGSAGVPEPGAGHSDDVVKPVLVGASASAKPTVSIWDGDTKAIRVGPGDLRKPGEGVPEGDTASAPVGPDKSSKPGVVVPDESKPVLVESSEGETAQKKDARDGASDPGVRAGKT